MQKRGATSLKPIGRDPAKKKSLQGKGGKKGGFPQKKKQPGFFSNGKRGKFVKEDGEKKSCAFAGQFCREKKKEKTCPGGTGTKKKKKKGLERTASQ